MVLKSFSVNLFLILRCLNSEKLFLRKENHSPNISHYKLIKSGQIKIYAIHILIEDNVYVNREGLK